ncbi:DNA repair exonuclease [Pigmentiphaga sp. NML080357]|uniref:metallophosphoesterase family protein n=1 Tax=Pigmentiphaga sp. NML080357 TaxID=2008675 RepID=UPI000B41A991|nr:metallophosphoesterase [Pigmentiphaga sp. NML080357]OVZ64699.1 DNA repair exonuclease [Pigmentiphaga sp. NML080357]
MTAILHISDTHFGTERQAVVDALVDLAQACRPEVVLLGGDITQRARRAQFARARRFVDRLGAPVLAVPGNHDIPLFNVIARLFDPYGHYRRAFGKDREPVHESGSVLAIGVDSTRFYRHKQGTVSRHQVERVANLLAQARPEQLRIVLMHHPLVAMEERDEENLARGRDYAIRAWSRAGADLVLGGHIHLPYVAALSHGGEARNAWAVQAGTAVSTRQRSGLPNSVNLLHWRPEADRHPSCVMERWDFLSRHGRFERTSEERLALARH